MIDREIDSGSWRGGHEPTACNVIKRDVKILAAQGPIAIQFPLGASAHGIAHLCLTKSGHASRRTEGVGKSICIFQV